IALAGKAQPADPTGSAEVESPVFWYKHRHAMRSIRYKAAMADPAIACKIESCVFLNLNRVAAVILFDESAFAIPSVAYRIQGRVGRYNHRLARITLLREAEFADPIVSGYRDVGSDFSLGLTGKRDHTVGFRQLLLDILQLVDQGFKSRII